MMRPVPAFHFINIHSYVLAANPARANNLNVSKSKSITCSWNENFSLDWAQECCSGDLCCSGCWQGGMGWGRKQDVLVPSPNFWARCKTAKRDCKLQHLGMFTALHWNTGTITTSMCEIFPKHSGPVAASETAWGWAESNLSGGCICKYTPKSLQVWLVWVSPLHWKSTGSPLEVLIFWFVAVLRSVCFILWSVWLLAGFGRINTNYECMYWFNKGDGVSVTDWYLGAARYKKHMTFSWPLSSGCGIVHSYWT